MWSTPSSTARRSTAMASSWSRGGPRTPGPGSCIAPNPTRWTLNAPSAKRSEVTSRSEVMSRATRAASESILDDHPGAAGDATGEDPAQYLWHLEHRHIVGDAIQVLWSQIGFDVPPDVTAVGDRQQHRVDARQRHSAQDERVHGGRQVRRPGKSRNGGNASVLQGAQRVGQRLATDTVHDGRPLRLAEHADLL